MVLLRAGPKSIFFHTVRQTDPMMLRVTLPDGGMLIGSSLGALGITWLQFQHVFLLFTLFFFYGLIDIFQKAGMNFEACTALVSALKILNCALSFSK